MQIKVRMTETIECKTVDMAHYILDDFRKRYFQHCSNNKNELYNANNGCSKHSFKHQLRIHSIINSSQMQILHIER